MPTGASSWRGAGRQLVKVEQGRAEELLPCGGTGRSCEAAGRSKGRGASWRKSGDVEESTTRSARRFALKDIAASGSIGNLMASHRCC